MKAPASNAYLAAVTVAMICDFLITLTTHDTVTRVVEAVGIVAFVILIVAGVRSRRPHRFDAS